jgi:hypothetical protein
MDAEVMAGAQEAAKELRYTIVRTSESGDESGESGDVLYGFVFDARGQEASVELLVNEADVLREGLTIRGYVRWEILDALGPEEGAEE